MAPGPICRYCGTPIAKRTSIHYFASPTRTPEPGELPQTKADAQRLVNMQIVSIQRWVTFKDPYDGLPGEPKDPTSVRVDLGIRAVGIWDGKSYVDPYFCKGEHARYFASAMARSTTFAMPEYHAAMAKRRKEPVQ